MEQAKKGKRIPNKSAATPPIKGATVEPTSQEMFVQLYAEAMFSVDESSATIAHRIGKYKPVAKPDSITQGIKSVQLLARAYINGGKTANNVPNACSRLLPYLSDRNPLGICMAAATAFDTENTNPTSVIDALRDFFM
jgi:hypothetical protein